MVVSLVVLSCNAAYAVAVAYLLLTVVGRRSVFKAN